MGAIVVMSDKRKWELLWWTLALAALAFKLATLWWFGASGDQDWYLVAARMYYQGKALYSDIFALTPPMIFWLYWPAVALAIHSGMADFTALLLLGVALTLLCIALCNRLLAAHPAFTGKPARHSQMALVILFMAFVWTNPQFALDREELFYLLVLPYIVSCMPGAGRLRRGEAVLVGVMAAAGLSIKPHCLLLLAALWLYRLIRSHGLRFLLEPVNVIILCLQALYYLVIWLHYPEYFTIVLPMAIATYDVITLKGGYFFGAITLLIFLVSFADFPWKTATPLRASICYWLMIAAALTLYSLANNGWGYAWNLVNITLLLATLWSVWNYNDWQQSAADAPLKKITQGRAACKLNLIANTLLAVVFNLLPLFGAFSSVDMLTPQLVKSLRDNRAASYGTISMNFPLWAEVSRSTSVMMDTRFSQLWMLPKFFVSGEEFARSHRWIIDYVTASLAHDLNTHQPPVVFVDETDMFYKIHHPIDLVEYLSSDAGFREAWSHYRLQWVVDECPESFLKLPKDGCKYKVFERVGR